MPAPDPNNPSQTFIVTPDQDFNENSAEIGAVFTAGGFSFLANYQNGNGIGILSDGDEGDIRGVNYLVQGTYKFTDKSKFGISYGKSKNDDSNNYNDVLNASLKPNETLPLGCYYALPSSITLAAEVGEPRSKDYLDQEAKQYGGSFGGIIFF